MTDKPNMSKRARALLAASLAALVVLWAAPAARPASAPVFRHALEQWPAADYEVVVFHRGVLEEEPQALVDACQNSRVQSGANVSVRTVDVAGAMDKSMEDLWTGQTDPQPPWMVVRAPETSPDAAPVWSGAFTAAALNALLDSPARRKITEALLRGATAVWVLLECGESARDEAAVDVLSSTLRSLEKKISLPGAGGMRSPLPLGIDFELVRVTRSDPIEELFVTLLEHGKPVFSSRPVVFPVFGRGRTLGGLVGREIDAEGIGGVCALLTSAVREGQAANPGRDLLLAADWKKIFDPAMARAAAKPAAVAAPVPSVSPVTAAPAVAAPTPRGLSWLVVLAVTVVGAAVLSWVLARKPGPPA